MGFYLTVNDNRREPAALDSVSYIHIKAKGDGSETAIVSDEDIDDPNVVLKTQDELQAILDQWVSDENISPEIDDGGNLMLQSNINLEVFLEVLK